MSKLINSTTPSTQSTSLFYFVLPCLQTVLPSSHVVLRSLNLYPVIIPTPLAQTNSQYHFKYLQITHAIILLTTSHYTAWSACTMFFSVFFSYSKTCTHYFAVLLRTTKLAQSESRWYFWLQGFIPGGFNPSEKYESQLGWWHSQYMET